MNGIYYFIVALVELPVHFYTTACQFNAGAVSAWNSMLYHWNAAAHNLPHFLD